MTRSNRAPSWGGLGGRGGPDAHWLGLGFRSWGLMAPFFLFFRCAILDLTSTPTPRSPLPAPDPGLHLQRNSVLYGYRASKRGGVIRPPGHQHTHNPDQTPKPKPRLTLVCTAARPLPMWARGLQAWRCLRGPQTTSTPTTPCSPSRPARGWSAPRSCPRNAWSSLSWAPPQRHSQGTPHMGRDLVLGDAGLESVVYRVGHDARVGVKLSPHWPPFAALDA